MGNVRIVNPDPNTFTLKFTFPNGEDLKMKVGDEWNMVGSYLNEKGGEMVVLHKKYTTPFAIESRFVEVIKK